MNESISKDPLYDEIMKNRCLTCYKDEKRLVPLTEKGLLKMFVPEITLTHGEQVCGDCESMLKTMTRFRNTVLTAQLLLKTAYEQQCQNVEQKIFVTKLTKEDIGCTQTSERPFDAPREEEIMEISIDFTPVSGDSEDMIPAEPSSGIDCDANKTLLTVPMGVVKAEMLEPAEDSLSYCNPYCQNQTFQQHVNEPQKNNPMESTKSKCEECGRWLGSSTSLKNHMERVHSEPAKYQCDKCDQKFKTATSLKVHIRKKHPDVARTRDVVCEQCGKAFLAKYTLERHMAVHTGARPHSCEDCGATFGFQGALYKHRRLKHKVPRQKDLYRSAWVLSKN